MFKQIPLGPIQTNAYVLYNEKKEAIVFDPGAEGQALVQWLNKETLKPIAILLTHAHFDHIGAVDEVRDAFHCPVYLHEKEAEWLLDPALNGSSRLTGRTLTTARAADHLLGEQKTLTLGDFTFSLYHTPGHSPGSITYYYKEEDVIFSGDVLFQQGIGRTDLIGGNQDVLLQSIHQYLLTLPESTVVASGHGPLTTIGAEMDHNPFLAAY
ncbi:glyoxylase-like metal-dependent hydrolase (beta-lactamase superfamily II) [Alkalihalobacillus xiaoxiensis]|uniref:Glyoxylase-like metal-dependent hydrolase (Beta-lactamase superfamily II) n=1 Tax=Shouchella xiaoxiensis TaxID=766895 RepID=A0ABS2SXS1_9BACI|nr:MBL fold metallo-hydrolase [Shouchella xiaoxiensis]MBM7840333.1 glyoxylase-like metal-dependent hydrolase (beta-lactamase superfamily II) [Shouchella xiaoxiensis]